ncbi:MAG: dienelactone hydrolase family protein, partial [Thermoplasmata archaeon]
MRDDDKMLDLPDAQFGSGVIGVCDICGIRQAVVVLQKERFKLCVIDFLNKTWLKSTNVPGAPLPPYRSERIWFPSKAAVDGKAPAIVLTPTKQVRHPAVLITPDVYGLTTTVLDAAIRFAREGFEVLLPDLTKTTGFGTSLHLALRSDVRFRGGVAIRSKRVATVLELYTDALGTLRARDMVDSARTALFGISYGGSLALALAAQDPKLAAVALAYPVGTNPPDLAKLVTVPILCISGEQDRLAQKARAQLDHARMETRSVFEFVDLSGARHDFLSRDSSRYDVATAEEGWRRIIEFLRRQLLPPPPKPPALPTKTAPPAPASAAPRAAVPST